MPNRYPPRALTADQAADYARRYGVSPDVLADGTCLLGRRAFGAASIDGFVQPEREPGLDLLDDEIDARHFCLHR